MGGIAAGCLASCGEEDSVLTSIKIASKSINTSYVKGATPIYDNLSIDLIDQNGKTMKNLKWIDNKDSITHSEIDTSELTSGKVFTVTYNFENKEYTDTLNYVVTETYTFSSWASNNNYTNTISTTSVNAKISTSEDSLETGFMKQAEFYVGNMNEVNLLPVLNGLDKTTPNYQTITLDKIPEGASVKLSSETGEDLAVEDYIENANTFVVDGLLKFKANVEGSFKVTLKHPSMKNEIVYSLKVVNGYNVTKATDLFAFYTATSANTYWPYYYSIETDWMKEWKAKYNLPEADNLIIQNDIVIGKSDLPDHYYWQESDGCDAAVVGSLKDWLRIFDHAFKNPDDIATIYGNKHSITLNNDATDENKLPYITTESTSGEAQKADTPISSHSTLFYASFGDNKNPFDCKLVFKDLQGVGNYGLSADDQMNNVGPMFLKSEINSYFDNCWMSQFFIVGLSDGPGSTDVSDTSANSKNADGKLIHPDINVDSSRFVNSGSSAIYVYGAGDVNINNSDVAKAGGPLVFLQPVTEKTADDAASALAFETKVSTHVDIDDKSFLSNWNAGKGGWFSAYEGASAIAGALQSMDGLFTPYGMTFLKTADDSTKFNFLVLNLPISDSATGVGLPDIEDGGTDVTVKKGGHVVYSTLEGYADVINAIINTQTSDAAAAYKAYAEALSGTFFGNNLAYANIANEIVFATTDKDGKHEFSMVNSDASGNYFLCPSDYAIKAGFISGGMLPATDIPSSTPNVKTPGLLSCTINGGNGQIYPSSMITNPFGYNGARNYGLVLGDYRAI